MRKQVRDPELSIESVINVGVRKFWEEKDLTIKIKRLSPLLAQWQRKATEGRLDHWKKTPQGILALILLYDQAPRMLFEDRKAYATDGRARRLTERLWTSRKYLELTHLQQMFAFFPFHHSENIHDQKRANKVFKKLFKDEPKTFEWIYRNSCDYNEIIERFGRFPHRNKILGRRSTKEEVEFLQARET